MPRTKSLKEKARETIKQEVVLSTLADLQRRRPPSLAAASAQAGRGGGGAEPPPAAPPRGKMERWRQKVEPVAAAKAFQRRPPAGRRPRTPDEAVINPHASKPPSEIGAALSGGLSRALFTFK